MLFAVAGTTFTAAKTFDWATCQNEPALTPVNTRDALLRSGGNTYFVDGNNCLHLKLTDPGNPWAPYTDNFARDGMSIEEEVWLVPVFYYVEFVLMYLFLYLIVIYLDSHLICF